MAARKYILILLLFSAGIALISCNRPKKRVFSGSVITKHKNPVPNAVVVFHALQLSGINGSTSGGRNYSAKTDAHGEFRADFKMRRKESVQDIRVNCDSGSASFQAWQFDLSKEIIIVVN